MWWNWQVGTLRGDWVMGVGSSWRGPMPLWQRPHSLPSPLAPRECTAKIRLSLNKGVHPHQIPDLQEAWSSCVCEKHMSVVYKRPRLWYIVTSAWGTKTGVSPWKVLGVGQSVWISKADDLLHRRMTDVWERNFQKNMHTQAYAHTNILQDRLPLLGWKLQIL